MKNYLSGEYFDLTKKLLLKMRMTFLSLMITASSLFASNVNSQDAKISLNLHDKSLFEVIDLIEKQTEYLFVYDKNDIDIDTKISVIANNLSVADVLSNILKRTDVIFAKVGTNIILLPKDNISVLQGSKVKGNVVDASTNEPIVGANIVIEGSTIGTITDINGRFSLDIPTTEAVIIASFIGYNTEKIIYTGQNSVEIRLIPDITKLEEIVVIGYGIAKRKDITGSISSVSSEKLKETPAISLNQAMQGKTAGVQVNLGDNAPGGGVSVSIRGVGSITQASDPIYVVDGVIMEGTLNHINVNDIESIDILKDASAAAIYGSRAANGVVLVTTKRGKEGTSNVSFLMRTSVQSVDNLPEMLTAQELANIRIEGNVNAQLDNLWRNNPSMTIGEYSTQFNKLKKEYMAQLPQTMFSETERNTLLAGESYNWLDEITQTGLVQDYTVAFSSGNEKSNYYISANYYNHKGLIIGSEHKRINLRINMEHQLKEWLKIGVNSNFTHGKTESIGESVVNGLGMNPMYPFFIDGVRPLSVPFYTSAGLNNPVLSQKIDNDFTSRRYSINTYLIVNFTKDLFLKSNIVADVNNNFTGYFAPSNIKEGEASNGIARINNDSWVDLLQENTLNYSKVFKTKHRINALIGNTVQVNDFRTNQQYATNFSTNALGYNNISSASVFAPGSQFSNKTKWQIASFIGRLIYSFDDKYIFTATGRFDGNSKYGTQNKWGFFPSFGGAWRLSNEKFMRGIRLLNDMKIRVSWGELGNSKIEPYSSFTKLSPGITVGADGKPLNTLQNTDQLMGNPDLRWERQQQYNIGLDAVALNNRLRLSLDVYKKISKDLILRTPLPLTTGYSLIYSNVGELQNKGLEITLGGRVIDRSLKWDIDLNWSANRNKLTKLYGGLTERLNNANNPTAAGWWVGKPLGIIYTYSYNGLWQWDDKRETMDLMKDGSIGGDTYYPGENKIADLDGDNKITTADRKIVGFTDPKMYGGLSSTLIYKNFSLDLNFNYVYGNKIFNRSYHEYTLGAGYGFHNLSSDALDRWTIDNQSGSIPRAHSNNLDRMLISSRLVQDGSYIRLKTATLNYNLPDKFLNSKYINSLSVYVSAENFWTLTNYKGANPEAPGPWSESYPSAKAITFGLNVKF